MSIRLYAAISKPPYERSQQTLRKTIAKNANGICQTSTGVQSCICPQIIRSGPYIIIYEARVARLRFRSMFHVEWRIAEQMMRMTGSMLITLLLADSVKS